MGHNCSDPAISSVSFVLSYRWATIAQTLWFLLVCSFYQSSRLVLLKKLKIKTVQSQGLLSSELDETYLNGLSQLGDEERILTTSSLKSILFNNSKSEIQIIAICTK